MSDSIINIVSRWSGKVLFSIAAASLKDAVLAAINYGANLYGANLYGADLSRADLYAVKNAELVIARTLIVPESGQFTGWKKCKDGVIVKVMIGKNARRSNASTRKCRAEYVKVLKVFGADVGISQHDNKTEYRTGQIVRCDKWDENRWNECSGGIHFFLTRIEAENYS